MSTLVKAKICWQPPDAGGRPEPPTGPRYSTVARFDEDAANWPQKAWSIVADFHTSPDENLCTIGDVRFLASDAPAHLLRPGSRFELCEGRRLVARCEVLASSPASSRKAVPESSESRPNEVVHPATSTQPT